MRFNLLPSDSNFNKFALALCVAAGLIGIAMTGESLAQTAPALASASATVRIRGTVLSVTPDTLTVKDRSGEVIELVLSGKLVVSEVFPIALADIKPGSYIGTAAMPQADGTLKAIAVSVFPEAARGTAEGHRPFDLLPQSTMTNATVSEVGTAAASSGVNAGRALQLKYKDGEKTVLVLPDTPVVTSRPADRSLLVTGTSVSLFAQLVDGKPTALRINAGKDGFVLPY